MVYKGKCVCVVCVCVCVCVYKNINFPYGYFPPIRNKNSFPVLKTSEKPVFIFSLLLLENS
jgi:hypothetical protein